MADILHDITDALRLPLVDAIQNASPAVLYEHAIRRGEAEIAAGGPLVADTGKFTGRSPKDKFVVRDAFTEDLVDWGPVNQALDPVHFDHLQEDMFDAATSKTLFVQELFAGADPTI